MQIDEWICKLDEASKEIHVYFKKEKKGSYKLIITLSSYCNKCMHPCINESLCTWHRSDEQIDKTFAIDIYYPSSMSHVNLMTQHVKSLKTNKEFAKPLSCAMIECIKNGTFPDLKLENIDYIVPVPKCPNEYKVDTPTSERYNQAEVIAKYLAENLKIKLIDALYKKKPFSLRNLNREQRRSLTHENYAVKQEVNNKLKGKKILLIDDIRTSGATANACAVALKSAGANKVYLYVAGRDVIPEVVKKCLRA